MNCNEKQMKFNILFIGFKYVLIYAICKLLLVSGCSNACWNNAARICSIFLLPRSCSWMLQHKILQIFVASSQKDADKLQNAIFYARTHELRK